MSAILKVKIPFFRRKTSGGANGVGTFYLGSVPKYLPQLNQVCMITHTNIPAGSGLANKLQALSTNVVTGRFQSYEELASQDTIKITDNYSSFFTIEYVDHEFSINQFSGDCTGFIEYDVNPATYQILKPVENVAIVNENVPYDLNDGIVELFCATGTTAPFTNAQPPVLPGSFIRLKDNNTIFANLLKSLNLPVTDEEMKKYTRSDYGYLTESENGTIVVDGRKYIWTKITSHTTGTTLTTHPTTGYTGEYYKTVMQTIGSIDYTADNSKKPLQNQVALVFEIPQAFYGEIIDGKTVHLKLPYWAATAGPTSTGIYTFDNTETAIDIYGTYNKNGTNLDLALSDKDLSLATLGARPDLERPLTEYDSNVVLLFANDVKKPNGEVARDWSEGHNEVMDGSKVFVENSQLPTKDTYNYNSDVCVGAVFLDKGFVVITHPQIVDSLFTKAFAGTISVIGGNKSYDFVTPGNDTRGLVKTNPALIRTEDGNGDVEWDNTQFVFGTGVTTNASLEYISYNSEKSLNVVCLASADEFYRSTNPTAKELLGVAQTEDFASFKSEDANLYPTMITQIGIHDAQGNLLAVCKPTQPVKKYWFDVVSFNVKIRL
jgi:hypothetical protein